MQLINRVFDRKGVPLLAGIFLLLFLVEGRRQLRKRNQPRFQRTVTNSLFSIPAFSLLRFLLLPVMVRLAFEARQKKLGLNHYYHAPPLMKGVVAFLVLDYTNYLWHVLNHKIPILWRFHLVHHTDPDLDVTTALRFHFGELIGSVFYRGACVVLSGATALQVLLYEILFEAATQFHHSNWQLPYLLEKRLNTLIVTPRMHGIHHSMVRRETDSNYSVIFSCWDRLHRTIRLNVPQNAIVTGVPSYSDHKELTIGYLWKLPFTRIRQWEQPGHTDEVGNSSWDKNKLAN
jgi:sterol desaturase/sphingolipid hydroxylase (fatty acid hydroxylase superfamily)